MGIQKPNYPYEKNSLTYRETGAYYHPNSTIIDNLQTVRVPLYSLVQPGSNYQTQG